jgi:predicted permease
MMGIRRHVDRLAMRLRSLVFGAHADAALKREIQVHLEEEIDQNVAAGMTAAEARAAALRAFGPVGAIEEACRDTRRVAFIEHIVQDLRYSLRALIRQPLLVAAATLSIGAAIGANATIFNLANELLLSKPTTRRADQLVQIRLGGSSHVSYRQWQDLDASHVLAGLTGFNLESSVNWRGPNGSASLMPIIVAPNFFDVLGVPVAMGRAFTADEARPERNPAVVVVSHGFWQRRLGGDPGVVGSTLQINGQAYTVLGVLPEGLRSITGFGIAPELYLPLSTALMPDLGRLDSAATQLVGRLHEGQGDGAARAALAVVVQRLGVEYGNRNFATVSEFSHIGSIDALGSLRVIAMFFVVLTVAVGLVLAIACANVAGLLLARATVRRREMALRVALGSSRLRLIQQLLAEGFWLALAGTVAGLGVMVGLMSLVSRVSLPVPLPVELRASFDTRLLAFCTATTVATTLLCALVPALQATRHSQLPALKRDETRVGFRRWSLRGLLVVAQVAVAAMLLVTASLFVRNLARAHSTDVGFDTARTMVAQIGLVEGRYTAETGAAWLDDAIERLRGLPGVRSASYAVGAPLTIRSGARSGARLTVAGTGRSFQAMYANNFVGPAYFETMGISLLEGREFRRDDRHGAPAAIVINEEFARRYFPDTDPLGAVLLLPGDLDRAAPAEIVGVVRTSKYRSLGEDPTPAMYEAYAQRATVQRVVHVLVQTTSEGAATPRDVAAALAGLDPSAAVEVLPMRNALAFAFLPSQLGAMLLGALGILGLTLATVGLFATVSFAVSRRTGEIGIRMALGATRSSVMRLVMGDAALLAATGAGIGLSAATLAARPLAVFLVNGLSATDSVALAGTVGLLAMVCVGAAWAPTRRAVRIDPVAALRSE